MACPGGAFAVFPAHLVHKPLDILFTDAKRTGSCLAFSGKPLKSSNARMRANGFLQHLAGLTILLSGDTLDRFLEFSEISVLLSRTSKALLSVTLQYVKLTHK